MPERFWGKVASEAAYHVSAVFGFGRRVCPGKAFAESSMFLLISNIIATMDLTKALDEAGNPITPSVEFNKSAVRCVDFSRRRDDLLAGSPTCSLGISHRSSVICDTGRRRRDLSSNKRYSFIASFSYHLVFWFISFARIPLPCPYPIYVLCPTAIGILLYSVPPHYHMLNLTKDVGWMCDLLIRSYFVPTTSG